MNSNSYGPDANQPTFSIGNIDSSHGAVNIIGHDQYNVTHNYNVDPSRSADAKIYQWLSAVIPSGNFNKALAERLESTGLWFINGSQFEQWKADAASFRWVHGSPGCGKTVLSAFVIENVTRYCEMDPSIACAYFFFDGRDGQKDLQLHESLVRSLILQLSTKCDTVPDALKALYDACHSGHSQPSIELLQGTLFHILELFRQVYIVVDALDECTERKPLLRWITDMAYCRTDVLHLLVTSRNEEDIAEHLQPLDPSHVLIDQVSLKHDIDIYLDRVLQTDHALKRWDQKLQKNIKDTLTGRADGMFRLVSLQIRELQDCYSEDAVEEQLSCLPDDLDKIYDRIVSKINKKHLEDARKILQWLAFSFRPLRMDEITQVVGVVPDSEQGLRFKPSRVYPDPRSVLLVCSGLVTENEGKVKLAHMSVKDYLLSHDHQDCASTLRINEKISHSFIAQTCLAYILQFDTPDMLTQDTVQNFPLAEYAAANWLLHFKSKGGERSDAEQKLINSLFQVQHSPPFVAWIWLFDPDDDPLSLDDDIPSTIYYASLTGLTQTVRLLLQKGADVNTEEGHHGNALQAASYHGHEAIVRLLLENGALVNACGGEHGNALQAASAGGHEAIAKLLLDKGADVEEKGGFYGNVLQAASVAGHEGILKLLLEKGVDVNAEGGYFGNALQAASYSGHEAAVKLLLRRGANVHAQGGHYGSALQAASHRGYDGVVKVLLEEGADVSAQGGQYGTAVQGASAGSHEKIVKLLLEKGADVTAQGGQYGNALQAASVAGHLAIVKILLEKGVDVNGLGGQYNNALYAASYYGYINIVKLLLQKGANVNALGGNYGNALQAASYKGFIEIVRLLLEEGADITAKGGPYGSALQAASGRGHEEIVRILLEKGADVNALEGQYHHALYAASYYGHKAVVKLLLQKHANTDAQGGHYGNTLQLVSARGDEAIVKLLLESGVDVNAQGGHFGSALQAASYEGHEIVVKLLLERGADVTAQGGLYGDAVQAAIKGGHDSILQVLKSRVNG